MNWKQKSFKKTNSKDDWSASVPLARLREQSKTPKLEIKLIFDLGV
jgi:hypothetical protein